MVLVNKVYQRKWDLGIDLVQAAFSVGKQGIPNRFPLPSSFPHEPSRPFPQPILMLPVLRYIVSASGELFARIF